MYPYKSTLNDKANGRKTIIDELELHEGIAVDVIGEPRKGARTGKTIVKVFYPDLNTYDYIPEYWINSNLISTKQILNDIYGRYGIPHKYRHNFKTFQEFLSSIVKVNSDE